MTFFAVSWHFLLSVDPFPQSVDIFVLSNDIFPQSVGIFVLSVAIFLQSVYIATFSEEKHAVNRRYRSISDTNGNRWHCDGVRVDYLLPK